MTGPFIFKLTDENIEIIQKALDEIVAERKESGDNQIQ